MSFHPSPCPRYVSRSASSCAADVAPQAPPGRTLAPTLGLQNNRSKMVLRIAALHGGGNSRFVIATLGPFSHYLASGQFPSRQTARRELIMTKQAIVAAAAGLFAACTIAGAAHAEAVKCSGINACKHQSSCQSASSSCKRQNACKGQGWSEASSAAECTGKGGKVL